MFKTIDVEQLGIPVIGPVPGAGSPRPGVEGATPLADSEHPYRPTPLSDGNLRVDPEIHLPSPGMDVDIAYYYNANATLTNGPFGFGRTVSVNLLAQASGSPTVVTMTRGNGGIATFQDNGTGNFSTLTPNVLTSLVKDTTHTPQLWLETTPDGQVSAYPLDTTGHVTSISYVQDAVGNRHTFSYASGYLSSLQDAVGRLVTFGYDANNLLQRIQDWATRVTSFAYDTASVPGKPLLTTVTGPTGCQTVYGYDTTPRLTSIIDPNGIQTTYSYYPNGKVSGRTVAGVGSAAYTYTGGVTVATELGGGITTYTRYPNGELATIADPTGVVTSFLRNARGQEWNRQNPTGAVSTVLYNANGIPIANVDPFGATTTYGRDAYNNPTSILAPNGALTTMLYGYAGSSFDTTGAKRRLQAQIDPLGNITSYAYNGCGQLTGMQDATGYWTTYTYDTLGNRNAVVSALGAMTTSLYDLAGNVVGTIDPLGYQTTIAYDAQNRPLQQVDALGYVTTMAYDGTGNLTVRINPLGQRTSYVYNAYDLPTRVTDALGNITTSIYDAAGRPVGRTNALGFISTTIYDAAGRIVAAVNALGQRTTTVYDAAGRAQAMVDALGNRTSTVYDLASRPVASVDQLGYRTSVVYDQLNRPVAGINPLGRFTTTVYDLAGRVRQMIDALGEVSSTVYDAVGRRLASVDALGNTSTSVYDAAGRIAANVNALGYRMSYSYDAVGRLVQIQDARGFVSSSIYDARGLKIANVDTRGNRITTSYDALGRRADIAQPYAYPYGYSADPQRTTWLYDAGGRMVAQIDGIGARITYSYDALGQQLSAFRSNAYLNITTSTAYDALGRLSASVDNAGLRTSLSYDALGRQISLQDASGNITSSSYDARGSLLSTQSAWGAFSTLSYDPVGNLKVRLDGRSWPTSYVYDALDRPYQALYPDGGRVTHVYDTLGRESALLDRSGVTTNTYDALGQMLRLAASNPDGTAYSLSYAYDGVGNRLWMADGEGHVTSYSYAPGNDRNNSVRVQAPYQPNPADMHFDERGRLFTTYPAQNTVALEERDILRNDQLQYLSYIDVSGFSKLYYSADVKTSDWVNAEFERSGGASSPFTYTYYRFDANEQLSYENRIDVPGYATTLTYDSTGNRITQNALGTLTSYSYLPGNRLASEQTGAAVTTYSYDQNGNQVGINVAGALTTNTYDAENRLSAVQNADGSAESMLYSANGPRKQRSVTPFGGSTSTTHFVYDGSNLLQERDKNGLIIAQYTWKPEQANMNAGAVWYPGSGGDSLLLQQRVVTPGNLASAATSIFAFDVLGRVRALYDLNDNVTDLWNWHAFGTLFSRTGTTVTPFAYGGKWGYYTDNARRLNVGWRVYDPTTGKWTSDDPIGFEGGDPNLSGYVKNNPARFVDPEGETATDLRLLNSPGSGCSFPSWMEGIAPCVAITNAYSKAYSSNRGTFTGCASCVSAAICLSILELRCFGLDPFAGPAIKEIADGLQCQNTCMWELWSRGASTPGDIGRLWARAHRKCVSQGERSRECLTASATAEQRGYSFCAKGCGLVGDVLSKWRLNSRIQFAGVLCPIVGIGTKGTGN